MKKPLIAIIDYGMGNLRSVQKALEYAGADARVTDSPALVQKAQGVVLPGVGAFGEAVRRLKAKKLWKTLQDNVGKNQPFLGICLGYQLLFENSQEAPGVPGLGVFKGSVVRFRFPKTASLKVPHMGWNTLSMPKGKRAACLKGIQEKDYFYFVHSFYPEPRDRTLVAGRTAYGISFAAAVGKGAIFACQFHPEKSGRSGQKILKNFVQEASSC